MKSACATLVATFCAILVVGVAHGGDIKKITDLAARLEKANAQKADALGEMTIADEQEPMKKKEKTLMDEQLIKLEPQVAALEKKAEAQRADAANVNAKIKKHKEGCTGALPKPTYDRCQGERPYLTGEQTRIDKGAADLEKEKKPLLKQVVSITDRSNQLAKEIGKLQASRAAAKLNLAKAQKLIDALQPMLRKECAPPNTPEALAYCGQVDWDGARKGLQAPELKPKPFSATPNN